MFGIFKKKPAPTGHFSRSEKFASIDAFEAALLRRGGLVTATPDFKVRLHFVAACVSAAFLNALAGANCRPLVDSAFATLNEHLKSNSDEFKPEKSVRWANFFVAKTRTIIFSQEVFLQHNSELHGSALTSSSTAYAALMQAFGQEAMNWVLARKDSEFGLPHAAALLCVDVMFGDTVPPDMIGDMAVSQALVEMIPKIIAT